MNSIYKCMLTAGLIVCSSFASAAQPGNTDFHGIPEICRTFKNGDIEVIYKQGAYTMYGVQCPFQQTRVRLNSTSSLSFKKSVLATCLTAQASGMTLVFSDLKCKEAGSLWTEILDGTTAFTKR